MINLKLSIYSFALILVMALLGAVFFSILVHEIVHIIQIDQPEEICLDFGKDTFMQVSGIGVVSSHFEAWAYAINALALVLLITMIVWIMWYKD